MEIKLYPQLLFMSHYLEINIIEQKLKFSSNLIFTLPFESSLPFNTNQHPHEYI